MELVELEVAIKKLMRECNLVNGVWKKKELRLAGERRVQVRAKDLLLKRGRMLGPTSCECQAGTMAYNH